MKIFIILLVTLVVVGCSDLLSTQKYIEKIQALEVEKQQLQRNINRLKARNTALEKKNEERMLNFLSMYKTGA